MTAAQDLMGLAEEGLGWLDNGPPEKRLAGLRNVLVFGRAAMHVLSILRRRHPGFDDWYEQNFIGMRDDPQMQSFEDLRKQVLKDTKSAGVITQLMVRSAGKNYGAPPKNARAFFTGDRLAGTGWEIVLPDGQIEKYYVVISDDRIRPQDFMFRNEGAPETKSIEAVCSKYISHLREMMRSATDHFA